MTQNTQQASAFGSTFWPGLILVAIGIAAYSNSLNGPFIFDDEAWIDQNPNIRSLWPLYQLLEAPPENPLEGRPVISLTIAVNYALGGRNVRGYHIFNLAVHLLAALTLMGIVKRTLDAQGPPDRFGQDSGLLAFGCALLWMIHPAQTECVNYITQRTGSIMGLFFFLTLYCAIRAREAAHRNWWLAGSIASCALGMASKEVMVTAPFLVFLYDLIYRDEPTQPIVQTARRRWPLYVGFVACWGLLTTLMTVYPHKGTVGFSSEITSWQYLKAQSIVIVGYIETIIWPNVLVLDYGSAFRYSLGEVAWYAAVIVVLLILTGWGLVKCPKIGYLGAWFFVTLAPTSSFVPILTEVAAERRLYLPLAAVSVLFVMSVHYLAGKLAERSANQGGRRKAATDGSSLQATVTLTLVLAVAVMFCWRTVRRNEDYASGITIMESAVAARPKNFRALRNLSHELLIAGRPHDAKPYYKRALDLFPASPVENYNLGYVCYQTKDYQEAIQYFRNTLELDPGNESARMMLEETQRELEARRATSNQSVTKQAADLEASAERFLSEGQNDLASEYFRRAGEHYIRSGAFDRAESLYRKSVQSQPNNFAGRFNLAFTLIEQDKHGEAVEHLRRAVALEPENVQARYYMGKLYADQKQYAAAKNEYRRALEIDPAYEPARKALGHLESQHPD